jgi:hypothetical protein
MVRLNKEQLYESLVRSELENKQWEEIFKLWRDMAMRSWKYEKFWMMYSVFLTILICILLVVG